ncbi:MAG: hypothetical protein K8S56_05490, partial [Candidatus Cloacimonetes bacterium]|nr:hypothetical protein [Candidatus Cloacimonadota bacterium]
MYSSENSNECRVIDANAQTVYFYASNLPVPRKEIEARIQNRDKTYRKSSFDIALDIVWLRRMWRNGEIPVEVREKMSFRQYIANIAPYSVNYCYRLEKLLYVVINYLEDLYKVPVEEVFR